MTLSGWNAELVRSSDVSCKNLHTRDDQYRRKKKTRDLISSGYGKKSYADDLRKRLDKRGLRVRS
jgi:hypothetical protein